MSNNRQNNQRRGPAPAAVQQVVESVDPNEPPPGYELDDDVSVQLDGGGTIEVLDAESTIIGQGTDRLDLDEDGRFDPAPPQDTATTTRNYQDTRGLADFQTEVIDEVEVLPTLVEDFVAAEETRTLRTNVEVGPVFYGQDEIHLMKGVLYRVPLRIFEYCQTRNLIWSLN